MIEEVIIKDISESGTIANDKYIIPIRKSSKFFMLTDLGDTAIFKGKWNNDNTKYEVKEITLYGRFHKKQGDVV